MSTTPTEVFPGGYPVTPQHEKNVENIENTPEHEKTAENITENSPVAPKHENKKSENKENKENQIREDFSLRFEPNPSLKATDDNDIARVTNQGSSALGGIGVNPVAFLRGGDESPPHPYEEKHQYEEKEAAGKEKEDAGKEKEDAGGGIDASHTIKPDKPTFDLTRDYNKQKEQEQIAEHKAKVAQEQDKDHKPAEKHHQKQKSESKKPERIDLGVKPLGNQQPPLPYKPEEPAGNTDRAHQPPGKTTVHPEGHNVGSKMTKKDKLSATINKAVGNFKQKVGKLTKNDNLFAKGTEKKAEADRTKEFAEVQKKMNEI